MDATIFFQNKVFRISFQVLFRVIIAGWIFRDAYVKKRYNKGPALAWALVALATYPLLAYIIYMLFRLPQKGALEKKMGKIDPEFMKRKYIHQNNILMVITLIPCGVIMVLLHNVIPTFCKMFQEIGQTLPLICQVESALGYWVWIVGILLIMGIIFFFKYPKMARFHIKHAPASYVIYIVTIILGLGIWGNLIRFIVENIAQAVK